MQMMSTGPYQHRRCPADASTLSSFKIDASCRHPSQNSRRALSLPDSTDRAAHQASSSMAAFRSWRRRQRWWRGGASLSNEDEEAATSSTARTPGSHSCSRSWRPSSSVDSTLDQRCSAALMESVWRGSNDNEESPSCLSLSLLTTTLISLSSSFGISRLLNNASHTPGSPVRW